MSLDKLDYVLALAEERNLTRAAHKAFISQPTLTNYINRLEEQLGVKLFDRSVTPIEITRAGALYIEQMKKIQLAETNLRNELRILGSMETVFHLGIGATRGNHWLPLLLPEFCRRHPEMGIQLHEQGEEFLEAGVRPGRILSYSNMSTARQLCALGLGALFVTGALFERTLPGRQERIAFCTLQQPVYTRTSVAAYRPENPRAALCREAIALTRELVLPRLELPV